MPELPEVETVVRGLRELLVGKNIVSIDHNNPKSFPNAPADVDQFVLGAKILDVTRRAKAIMVHLDSDYSLIVHLKMTGQMVYVPAPSEVEKERFGAGHPSASLVNDLPDSTTRVTLDLDNGATLYFNDMRKFGWMRLHPTNAIDEIGFIAKLGPDALSISAKEFRSRMTTRQKSIKACLLDQTIVAGCGNIYADESLWAVKIHPSTPAKSLTKAKYQELHKALQDVLKMSIEKGGSSSKNYVNAEGKKGSYLDFANVYKRAGQSCNRCNTPIERIVVATRGTHICPSCQKLKGKK